MVQPRGPHPRPDLEPDDQRPAPRLRAPAPASCTGWAATPWCTRCACAAAATPRSGHPQMYAPDPLEGGSSVSHWDTAFSRNVDDFMEPFATRSSADLLTGHALPGPGLDREPLGRRLGGGPERQRGDRDRRPPGEREPGRARDRAAGLGDRCDGAADPAAGGLLRAGPGGGAAPLRPAGERDRRAALAGSRGRGARRAVRRLDRRGGAAAAVSQRFSDASAGGLRLCRQRRCRAAGAGHRSRHRRPGLDQGRGDRRLHRPAQLRQRPSGRSTSRCSTASAARMRRRSPSCCRFPSRRRARSGCATAAPRRGWRGSSCPRAGSTSFWARSATSPASSARASWQRRASTPRPARPGCWWSTARAARP